MRQHLRSFLHRRPLALLIAAGAAATAPVAVACHPAPRDTMEPSPNSAATLVVDNRGFTDMTIYVLRGGTQRIRIGLAIGSSTQRFTIPADIVAGSTTLRFIADPIGGRRSPVSDEIAVRAGDTVTLTIPPS